MKKTKKNYIKYLDGVGETLDKEDFILGGRYRGYYFPLYYGIALRRHDPVAFMVGFREWSLK